MLARRTDESASSGSGWPTPTAMDSKSAGRAGYDYGNPGTTLTDAMRLWPTPDASVSNDSEAPEQWRERQAVLKQKGVNGNGAGVPLAIASKEWPHSLPDRTTAPDGKSTSSDGRVLNPRFVEVLMGFPIGWTDFELLETPSSRDRRESLSRFLLSVSERRR